MSASLYEALSEHGFRRSGAHVYRPQCAHCKACVPARVPVAAFSPNRTQRRCLKRNSDLTLREVASIDTEEHYRLYERYISERHRDGDMYPTDREQFRSFLTSEWNMTRYVEMRLDDTLLGVIVSDQLNNGLSAMYTFFDPDEERRSLGRFAILWQIIRAREMGLAHVYLGYWIKQSPKMRYKTEYRPLELLVNGRWTLLR